jgi:hypothetical protein
MKKLLFIIVLATSFLLQAQDSQFGIKAGLNYNFSGDLTDLNELENTTDDVVHGADSKAGFHGGLWYQLNYSDLFIKGELLYTQYENTFSGYALTTKSIDVPVVVGMKILGPLYIFAGPDFQYILAEDFSLANSEVTSDDFTMGLHLGIGVEFKRLSFDARWEKGLTGDDLDIINSDSVTDRFTLDNRPNQLLFSIQYSLTKSKE